MYTLTEVKLNTAQLCYPLHCRKTNTHDKAQPTHYVSSKNKNKGGSVAIDLELAVK